MMRFCCLALLFCLHGISLRGAAFVAASTYPPQEAQTAQSVYARVQKLYGESESIRAQFLAKMPAQVAQSTQPAQPTRGTLLVKRGNRFRLDIPDRTIVCDGKTVWNYDRAAKKLIISPFKDNPATVSPEKIFLSFPSTYKPTLKQESKKDGGLLLLTLTPASAREVVGGMQRVALRLQPKTLVLKELTMSDESSSYNWTMMEFTLGVALLDEQFEFQPPKDASVIDLRD